MGKKFYKKMGKLYLKTYYKKIIKRHDNGQKRKKLGWHLEDHAVLSYKFCLKKRAKIKFIKINNSKLIEEKC